MANQLTPAELRETAKELRDMAETWDEGLEAGELAAMRAGAGALDRLADVIEHAESERERLLRIPAASMYAQGQYDLHDVVLRIARGDTTNENRSE